MKPFLGIDITTDKKNETFNGEEFIVMNASDTQADALEEAAFEGVELLDKARLPLPLRIVQWVCGIGGFIVLVALLKACLEDEEIRFADIYQDAPWLFWLIGICLVIWGVLTLLGHRKEKETLESEKNEQITANCETIATNIRAEFAVPADALTVDVLSFSYKIKNGKPIVKEKALQLTPYINFEFKAFADQEHVFLADLESKYAFALSELRAIRTVKKHISVMFWNKEEEMNKGGYKPYKLWEDKYGCANMKTYHVLELEHEGEIWGIYFPCYELPIFEKLTGLTAE